MISGATIIAPALVASALAASAGAAGAPPDGGAACPVTLVDGGNGGTFENDALRVGLWPEGKVVFKPDGPGSIDADGALGMKFWWWRLRSGRLTISGRRLDGPARPLRAVIPEGYGDVGFQAVGLTFPTTGCWEVTGHVGGGSLTFVTLVERIDRAPAAGDANQRANGPQKRGTP